MNLPRLRCIWPGAVVGLLVLCFGVISYLAVLGKSATYDEPLHVVGGMVHRYENDYRINPEDPALFGWWASLPHKRNDLPLDTSNAFYEGATTGDTNQQWFFVNDALYAHDGARAHDFLNTSRGMFVLLGMGLAALIACWAYQISGKWAALSAAALFCFDPNFLAHSALVKNDVPLSLMMCLLGFFIWRFGRSGGWYWFVLAAITCGLALNVKFSAVLFGPVAVLLLIVRAVLPIPWKVAGRSLATRRQRAIAVAACAAAIFLSLFIITWAVYGFRYSATASGQALASEPLVEKAVTNGIVVELGEKHVDQLSQPDLDALIKEKMQAEDFALPVRIDLWMQKHHLLPEGWLYGFLYTYATTLVRSAFLVGEVTATGRWYYFPLAIAFKTPAATLAAFVLVPIICAIAARSESTADLPEVPPPPVPPSLNWWTALVLIIPPLVYFAAALTTNLNLGLRHILPIYPYIFIALGVAMGLIFDRLPSTGVALLVLITFGIIAETTNAYPNFLAFFNAFCGGSIGGIKLLGDSNLDWGQDLPALAAWQKAHPYDKLYLCYFGMADPKGYGIDFINLPGGWPFAPVSDLDANQPGVIAISATNLQGIYNGKQLTDAYQNALKGEKPFKVLNGTIYLFNWPPTAGESGN